MSDSDLYTDYLVIGAGVIGLAIAKKLSDQGKDCLVLEKNHRFGEETSSRNSEVIHAGIYYPKGSLKAKLCIEGKEQLYQYCHERAIPYKRLGKFIVATTSEEASQLEVIKQKAQTNGVNDLIWKEQSELTQTEPNVKAHSALFSPSTGILDAHQFMLSLTGDIENAGNAIAYNSEVLAIEQTKTGWLVSINNQGDMISLGCRWLINSAGLWANQLAKQYLPNAPSLYFCRGLYFSYSGKAPFQHLIYPVPEKNTVGLGIHSTLDLAGQVKFGPDTCYLEEINYTFPEDRPLENTKERWINAIRRYFPNVEANRLQPAYTGIRPKLSAENKAAKDFVIEGPEHHGLPNLIHLLGIESPGLTSSLAIANYAASIIRECEE